MNRNDHDDRLDQVLDDALSRLRGTAADDATVAASAARSLERLRDALDRRDAELHEAETIRSCDDWQRLIPAYLDDELSAARRMLFEDHSRECVSCRRALKQARSARAVTHVASGRGATRRAPGWRRDWTWGAVAAAFVVFALIGVGIRFGGFGVATGGLVRIETVDGTLMQVADLLTTPAVAGEQLRVQEPLRTGRESGAVMTLEDGSRIEMNERSELSVRKDGDDDVILLERGDILVEATHRDRGRLFVRTGDCRVEVTGTVFTVSAGTKGSRVSVLQGEVWVEDDEGRRAFGPGAQYVSSRSILPVPVAEDVAWSRDADHWLAVTRELEAFQEELDRRIGDTSRRYDSRLLDHVPADTVVYVAIPNLTDVVTQAHDLLIEKIGSSPTLATWWQDNVVDSGADAEIQDAIDLVGRLGGALGEEILVTLQPGADGEDPGSPLVFAEVTDADTVRAELDRLIARITASGDEAPLARVEDPAGLVARTGSTRVWVGDDLLVLATDQAGRALTTVDENFRSTPFGKQIAEAYRDGVGLLVGADLATLVGRQGHDAAHDDHALQALGLDNIGTFILSRSDLGEVNRTRATLTVRGEREGVLSWLAEPAPMGSLEFVSPDALAVSAFVVRRPATLLEDLFSRMGDDADDVRAELDRFRQETGIDLIDDIAGALGGEFALALDGPVLPKPAWKAIVEVYDPGALQRTLEWSVEQLNGVADQEGRGGFRLVPSERRGRTYWAIESDRFGVLGHYTFVDGYWILASQDAMIDRALQFRASGVTLGASRKFLASLPEDGNDNVSAVLYQDLGRILGTVLDGPIGSSLGQERRDALRSLASDQGPTSFVAYGRRDRIQVVGVDRGSFLFGNQLSRLFNIGSLVNLGDAIDVPGPAGSGYDVDAPDTPDRSSDS